MAEQLKQNAKISSYGSGFNAQDFFVRQIIKRMVSTAIPVRVDRVDRAADGSGALYVDATPLICQTAADGTTLDPVSIPHLPYFRYQHGTAAVICDPKVGDVGLAIFAQQDVSRLSGGTEPVGPGSFRCFDMSDGFYIGGFWGQKPKTFIRIEDTGDVTITAPQTVVVNTAAATVNASSTCDVNTATATVTATSSVTIDTPATHITGTLQVDGHITGSGGLAVSGGSGAVVSGDVTADGISLKTHVHGGVESGGSTTGGPQ